jgi:ankyrin repeat protein
MKGKWLIAGVVPLLALFVSCESRQRGAMAELSRHGFELSGRSLVHAVEAGDHGRAALLLEAGVFTGQRDARGRNALGIAVENRDFRMLWMLLNAGADINAVLDNRASVLGIAVDRGDGLMFETLLAAGASAGGLMPDGERILPWAIRNGHLTIVRRMLSSGADPHLKDRDGNPVLHVAMAAGHRELTEKLLEIGADPGGAGPDGTTTLHHAFERGWDDLVPRLAAEGADPNGPGPDGTTLLEDAVQRGDLKRVAVLMDSGAVAGLRPFRAGSEARSPLELAFEAEDSELFELLLTHGARPSGGDWEPWLQRAFARRDLDKVRLLASHGARESMDSRNRRCLVERATLQGDIPMLKLLLDFGFRPGKAVYHAAASGAHDMLDVLLASGVSPDFTVVPTLDTALAAALRGRHDRAAHMLVRAGAADRPLRLPEGQSAFHLAVTTGCHRATGALLDAGADPNEPFATPVSSGFLRLVRPGVMRWVFSNDQNPTPLMVASDSGVTQTARHLIRAGAKTNVRTRSSSLWPINFASRRSDVPMMRLFLGQDPHREERLIEVRLSEQRARLFDREGNELLNTQISTGRKGYATPTGDFVITNKYRDWTSTLYHASMPYFQRFSCGDFGFHQGYVPGYPASHGCIRVPAGTAAKLFALTQTGDRVRILP